MYVYVHTVLVFCLGFLESVLFDNVFFLFCSFLLACFQSRLGFCGEVDVKEKKEELQVIEVLG